MRLKVKRNLNVRKLPDLDAGRIGIVLAGTEIQVEGSINGESIDGNALWYFDRNRNYYWSGGLDVPVSIVPEVTPSPVATSTIFVDYGDWIIRDNPAIKTKLKDDAIRIAVLDSGIYEDHPDFKGAFDPLKYPSLNCTSTPNVKDVHGHGTHVAGLIGGRSDDKPGIIGVASKCILRNIKVNDDSGNSRGDALLAGLENLSKDNVDIVNLSLDITFQEYKKVENKLKEISQFAVIVAAAGNNNTVISQGDILYPAFSPFTISVGAINEAFFNIHDSPQFNKRIDFILPQLLLMSCSTKERNFYAEERGSSMAAALVSGIIARIIQTTDIKSPEAIRTLLNQIAKPYSTTLDINSLTLIKPP